MRSLVSVAVAAIVVNACSVLDSTEPTRLTWEGRSEVVSVNPVSVDAVVTVRNTGHTTTTIHANHCPLYIAAYLAPEREGEPVWNSLSDVIACTLEVRLLALGPGDYYDFHVSTTLPASLPRGQYYLGMVGAKGAQPVAIGQVSIP